MVEIIALEAYRQESLLRAGYERWRLRYNQAFDARTGLKELLPETLYQLSIPEGAALADLYALIIGFLGYGAHRVFHCLEPKDQTLVLDIQLFLSDQIRFEMMQRLGWLDRFEGNRFSLLETVTDFDRVKGHCLAQPPALAKNHPDYDTYRLMFDLDQQVFLRRLFPDVLDAFKSAHGL